MGPQKILTALFILRSLFGAPHLPNPGEQVGSLLAGTDIVVSALFGSGPTTANGAVSPLQGTVRGGLPSKIRGISGYQCRARRPRNYPNSPFPTTVLPTRTRVKECARSRRR